MKHNLKFLSSILLGTMIFFAGCNKDDDDSNPEPQTISFDKEEILNQLPDALRNSTDPAAQVVLGWVESATDWSTFDGYFSPADGAIQDNESYTWSATDFEGTVVTYWWKFEEDASKNYWTLELQFNDGIRAPFIESWEMKDGTGGEVKYSFNWLYFGEEEYEELYWIYKYTLDEDGKYTFTWEYESDSDEYDNFLSYNVVVNADGSGTVDYYSLGELFYHAEWDADGNGSYSSYINGEVFDTQSWTVN